MIVTDKDARTLIQRAYGTDFKFRLTTRCQIGTRPTWQTTVGMVTLAWRKLAAGKTSAVAIGRLSAGGSIDWTYNGGSIDWTYKV